MLRAHESSYKIRWKICRCIKTTALPYSSFFRYNYFTVQCAYHLWRGYTQYTYLCQRLYIAYLLRAVNYRTFQDVREEGMQGSRTPDSSQHEKLLHLHFLPGDYPPPISILQMRCSITPLSTTSYRNATSVRLQYFNRIFG
jgi:hypothetical protein